MTIDNVPPRSSASSAPMRTPAPVGLPSSAVATNRMNREQFFAQLATLDDKHLKTALWNLYWRGSAAIRERIEAEINPAHHGRHEPRATTTVDPAWLLGEVRDFVTLARSGAYMGGDRRVSPRERTQWRSTFRRLISDAQQALRTDTTDAAATALEHLIDLACQMRDYDYFRSEDPVAAARFVVSDAAGLLWAKVHNQYGFPTFAQRAMPQLIRWESHYGWTRRGDGQVSQKETALAHVLAQMLPVPDMWVTVADHYLDALDQVAHTGSTKTGPTWRRPDFDRGQRTEALGEWHLLLLGQLIDSEAEDRLDRVAHHPALGGPELDLLQAQLAHHRGDLKTARSLVNAGLQKLPGHPSMLALATKINTPLPPRAEQLLNQRSR